MVVDTPARASLYEAMRYPQWRTTTARDVHIAASFVGISRAGERSRS